MGNEEQHTENLIEDLGFDSIQEFFRMTSRVYIDTPERRQRFEDWRDNDGTKAGLLKVIEVNGTR